MTDPHRRASTMAIASSNGGGSVRLLIIEDDANVALNLRFRLSENGYEVSVVRDLVEVQRVLAEKVFDVILLDLLLPDGDGLAWLKDLRSRGIQTPVIITSALGQLEQRVAGLNAGSDDYLTKPFDHTELIARIEAVRRRTHQQTALVLSAGDLRFDVVRRLAFRAGREIRLKPKEADLLEYFLQRPDVVLSREEILRKVWGVHFDPQTNVVDVYVSYLRSSIDEASPQKLIMTIRGQGFMLKTPTSVA